MTRPRHDELTTDDLLKLQEGPPAKKIRLSSPASVDFNHFVVVDSDSESNSTSPSSPGNDLSNEDEHFQDEVCLL